MNRRRRRTDNLFGQRVRPERSLTRIGFEILRNIVGRSPVSAMTQTPASGPAPLVTTPVMTA